MLLCKVTGNTSEKLKFQNLTVLRKKMRLLALKDSKTLSGNCYSYSFLNH